MNNTQKGTTRMIYLLLAAVVAIGIWFYVDTYGDNGSAFPARQEVSDIPIEYTGEAALAEQGLMLLRDGTTDSVDLTFEGPRLLVSQLDRSKIRISANLSDIKTAGVQTVNYSYAFLDDAGRATFPARQKFAQATIFSRSVDTATVNISELYRKEIDVRCELIGRVASGYSAGQLQMSPSSVEIQGLESDIASISYAKISLNLGSGAEESVSETLECQFYDENDEPVEPEHFTPITTQIQVTLPVYVTKELTLEIDFTDTAGARMRNVSYEIDPQTVTVTGEASRLKNVTSITLGGFNLMNLVNAGVTTQPTYHSYAVIVPDGCENESGISRATLKISFKDMTYGTVTTTRFSATGNSLPEGKNVEILTESLDVSVFGPKDAVEALTGVNLLVTPDLSDYGAASGVYTVPALVSLRSGFDIGILGTYQIRVNITDTSGEADDAQVVATVDTAGGDMPEAVTADMLSVVTANVQPLIADLSTVTAGSETVQRDLSVADSGKVTADTLSRVKTDVQSPVSTLSVPFPEGNADSDDDNDNADSGSNNAGSSDNSTDSGDNSTDSNDKAGSNDNNADSEDEEIAIFMTDVWHNVTADTVEIMLTNSENTASGNS